MESAFEKLLQNLSCHYLGTGKTYLGQVKQIG